MPRRFPLAELIRVKKFNSIGLAVSYIAGTQDAMTEAVELIYGRHMVLGDKKSKQFTVTTDDGRKYRVVMSRIFI
jgi:hypothetical protein